MKEDDLRTYVGITVACTLSVGIHSAYAADANASDVAPLSTTLAPVGPGTLDSPVSDGRSGFELTTSTEESRAAFKLARTRSKLDGNVGVYDTFALTASAPLSKGGSSTSIATLSGFANDFLLKVAVSEFRAP